MEKIGLKKTVILGLILLGGVSILNAQDTVRVMTYNILRYGAQGIQCTPTGVSARNTWFIDILSRAKPDIFGVNEIGPVDNAVAPHVNVSQNILPNIGYGNYEATQIRFESHQDICNMMWYNADKIGFVNQRLIDVTGTRRDLDFYKFYYKSPEPITDSTFVYVVLMHLMAGSASDRSDQTNAVMTHLANNVGGPNNIVVMGDMNMDSYNSGAFQNMVAYPDLDIRLRDPLNLTSTWNNNNAARHSWSQSTPGGAPCGAGTNLNDRFDLIICSNAIMSGTEGMEYINGSYQVMGNPFAPNPSVPAGVAGSLAAMSDHFPVILDLQVDQSVSRERTNTPAVKLNVVSPSSDRITGNVEIPTGKPGTFNLKVRDLNGRTWITQTYYWGQGKHDLNLPIDQVQSGILILELTAAGYEPVFRKIVVMN